MSEEIKEVHIKTYDEWLKYYKNATKEQVIKDLTQDVKYFADAVKDIKELRKQLQQKENIIKEVREEIRILESNCDISDYQAQKLYHLLDKGE